MIDDNEEEFLLLKVLPEQVSSNWDKIAPALEKSLPPTVTNRRLRMSNVLRAILVEDLTAWIYYDSEERERYLMTTLIRTDEVTLGKDLLIYTFTALSQLTPELITNGFQVIEKYAKGNNCSQVLAYVSDKRIVNFLKEQGAEVNYNLIQIEV